MFFCFLEKYIKSPENLIPTLKHSVYKAFKAFKYLINLS